MSVPFNVYVFVACCDPHGTDCIPAGAEMVAPEDFSGGHDIGVSTNFLVIIGKIGHYFLQDPAFVSSRHSLEEVMTNLINHHQKGIAGCIMMLIFFINHIGTASIDDMYINLETAKDFNTVIFPLRDNPLCLQIFN